MGRLQIGDVAQIRDDPVYRGVFGTIVDTTDDGRSALLWIGGDKMIVALRDELVAPQLSLDGAS